MEPVENTDVAVEEHVAQPEHQEVHQEESVAPVVEATVSASEATAAPAPAEAVELQINDVATAGREYPSLYDTKGTTVVAILLGISIVAAIQFGIVRMYTTAKSEQIYLTRFVTALVGLVMGAYIADLLIAGPSTNLLSDEDHTMILAFVKDIALMIFAYYFGTKSKVQDQDGEGA
jgi:hypothetical protein